MQELSKLFDEPSTVSAIHYSCESFHDLRDGRSPRVTSISICNLASLQTESFAIHRTAEIEGVSFARIEANYDQLEKNNAFRFL